MVSRTSFLTMLLTIYAMIGISTNAFAETELNLSVDKDKLYQNEILNLTVQANTELDFSLGGLMNFGGAQVESPSFEGIEQDWEIIDKQQSYNMQSINGKTQSMITWRYALSPKRSGFLQIPVAKFQDSSSSPINIEVIQGSRPHDESNPPAVFLKASIDKPSPYLQEQVIYTLELYTLGEARGDMGEPSHPDLIIEPLGEISKTYKMRFNRRYEVYERRYLLFPQKSGPLTVSPQEFSGTVLDMRTRRRGRARELSNAVTLQVRQPPTIFSGHTWLPATSLFINENYDPDSSEIKQGGSITRKINISTLGLLGSALPELPTPEIDGLKIYPDQPQVNASEHAQGVQSSRLETQAMVAISPGEYTLPAIELKWWDTINDVERTARVPERKITVLPSNNASPAEQTLDNTDRQQTLQTDATSSDSSSAEPNGPVSEQTVRDPQATTDSGGASKQLWMYTTLAALMFWAAHAVILYRRLNHLRLRISGGLDSRQPVATTALQELSAALITAAQNSSNDLALKARSWLSELEKIAPQTTNEIKCEFKEMVTSFEAMHFSVDSKQMDDKSRVRFIELVKDATATAVSLQSAREGHNSKQTKSLKPFYPA